jgi:hypothetical protein
MKLNAGETVRPSIYNSNITTASFRVGTGNNDGFVNFSAVEL